MKMLKLSAYCAPEQVASSHLGRDLQQAYLEHGFYIENFVPTPTRNVTPEVRKQYKKIKYEEMENGHIIIHRFAMFGEGKNPILRAVRYVLVNLAQYYKGSHAKGIDLISAGSTPPTQGLLCAKVKKKLSKRYGHPVPFVFNLQDIFPDSLVNAKMTHKGSLIWKIGRKIEDFAYANADKIIVISEDFKRNIMEKGVPEEKIVIIPNWVNTDNVYPIAREDNILFERFGLDRDKFYICYSGNIGHSQNMNLLLDTAAELQTSMPDVHFVVIGEGAAKEEVVANIAERKLENVHVYDFQPYEDIASVFSLGDAGLIISKGGIGGSSVPSKTWSIMAAERPILASFDTDSELSKLVKQVGCGVTAEADSKEALIAAIRKLYEADRAAIGQKGRRYLKENLDKDQCTAAYIAVMEEAVAK